MTYDDPSDNPDAQSQSHLRFEDSPQRFREAHANEHFSGSSGMLFEQAMSQTRMAMCLTDPNQSDNPIVFANHAFRHLTGYEEDEILGRNCRFLQGPDTDPEPVRQMREAVEKEDVAIVEVLNYRKDGTTFWNALHLGPVYDETGELLYYFGSQWDVSNVKVARAEEQHARMMARELSHRMKNMFSVISGIVNVTGRMAGVEKEAAEINSRIQALGRAYETTLDDSPSGKIEIGQSIRAILEPYDNNNGRLNFQGNGACVPFSAVSTTGLVLHELAANSTKYGAWSRDEGIVTVGWNAPENGEELYIEWIESNGPRIDRKTIEPGMGSAIVERMLRAANGSIKREWNETGLQAVISIPTKG